MIRVKTSGRATHYKQADSFDDGAGPSGLPWHTTVTGRRAFGDGQAEPLSNFEETEHGS